MDDLQKRFDSVADKFVDFNIADLGMFALKTNAMLETIMRMQANIMHKLDSTKSADEYYSLYSEMAGHSFIDLFEDLEKRNQSNKK